MKKLCFLLLLLLTLTACQSVPQEETTTAPTVTETVPPTLGQTGKCRVAYRGSVSAVKYVTSPDQLPDVEDLQEYDAEWFRDHALILVTETVPSGSIQVAIESVSIDGDTATVTLSHTMEGDAGTMDMAAWLLWAEVEPNLTCTWTIANPALKTETITD